MAGNANLHRSKSLALHTHAAQDVPRLCTYAQSLMPLTALADTYLRKSPERICSRTVHEGTTETLARQGQLLGSWITALPCSKPLPCCKEERPPVIESEELEICIADEQEARQQGRVGLSRSGAYVAPNEASSLLQQARPLFLKCLEPLQSVNIAQLAGHTMQSLCSYTSQFLSMCPTEYLYHRHLALVMPTCAFSAEECMCSSLTDIFQPSADCLGSCTAAESFGTWALVQGLLIAFISLRCFNTCLAGAGVSNERPSTSKEAGKSA